jgi:hypothetical protein
MSSWSYRKRRSIVELSVIRLGRGELVSIGRQANGRSLQNTIRQTGGIMKKLELGRVGQVMNSSYRKYTNTNNACTMQRAP